MSPSSFPGIMFGVVPSPLFMDVYEDNVIVQKGEVQKTTVQGLGDNWDLEG